VIQEVTRRSRLPAILVGAVVALAACSANNGGASTAASAAASAAASSTGSSAPASVAPINFSAALVVSGNLGDKGFFDSAEAGVVRAVNELGITQKTLQASPTDPAQWLQNLQAVSDGSYNVVIAGSTQQHDNVTTAATAHPDQHYIFFDDQVDLPNVLSIEYKQNEGSYVAGVLAGLVTTDTADFPLSKGTKTVGLVGGMDIPVINDFVVGFKQGAKSVDSSINVIVSYAGSFSDPNKGYNLTQAMYDQGADIVFAVAGGTGLGVLKASADSNKYSIGVDSDQNDLYPGHVLASMVKRVDNSLFDSIKAAIDGTAQWGQLIYYGLQNNGVGLIIDTKDVPQSVQDQITAATAKVASGEVTVDTAIGAASPSP
jgi:basic membrane protein A and related proteins